MTRVSALLLIAIVPLLSVQPAGAQDCFCGAPLAAPAGNVFGVVDGVVDGVAPETPDTTIESSDPLAIADAHAPTPARHAVLWCSGSGDPRCMPIQTSDAPSMRALSGGPVATAVDIVSLRRPRTVREAGAWTPAEGLAPALGVQRSIDRPPRS
jgi:hypothetical protein